MLGVLRALRADASKGNLAMAHSVASRHLRLGAKSARWQIHVEDSTALVAIKMTMLPHVWAKPSRTSVEIHLANQITLNQSVQAVVNRRHRDLRHRFLCAHENLFGGRMITSCQKHVVDMLSLRGKTKATRR